MPFTKFHENLLIIDGEINEKQDLKIVYLQLVKLNNNNSLITEGRVGVAAKTS